MDQEGMTDEHVTGGACGNDLTAPPYWERDLRFVTDECAGKAFLAGRSQQPCHLQVRPGQQAGRGILRPNIGDQAQQKQGALLRSVVDEPTGVTCRLETDVNVPSSVSGICFAGESNYEGSQVRTALPSIRINKLSHGLEQSRSIGSLAEAIPRRHPPYSWSLPGILPRQVDTELLRC